MLLQASLRVTAYYVLMSAPAHVCMWLPTVAPHGVTVEWFLSTGKRNICGVCVLALARIQIVRHIRGLVWELPQAERRGELLMLLDHFKSNRTYTRVSSTFPTPASDIVAHLSLEGRIICPFLDCVFRFEYDADISNLCFKNAGCVALL